MTGTMPSDPIGVGIVGYSFMGRAHSHAWRSAGAFFDLPLRPVMTALVGRDSAKAHAAAAEQGWRDVETDYKALLSRDDIDVVDICTPGDTHPEIAIAALDAGKHVLCEKPLANSVAEADAMAAAAERAAARGVRSMVGFNYRRVPALAMAHRLVSQGLLGTVRHVRAQYLQDFLADPDFPLVWRLQRERAGSGALGDIGAHIVDLAQHLTGQHITGVSGMLETFIGERPLATASDGLAASGGLQRGPVTVDDAALFTARFDNGAIGSFEATRMAVGRKNAMRIEINGSDASVAFDFESMNELQFYDHTERAETAGFRRILVTEPGHPYMAGWWPPGHLIGYEHSFTHEVKDFVEAVAAGTGPAPSFADGLRVQRVLAAVEASAANASIWTSVDQVSERK